MGALVHGRGVYAFTYLNNVKTGTNIVIECLHRIFIDLRRRGPLPATLFLQVDNTAKQNKNSYMFGYLGCLVQWGLFAHVSLSFLPVGHTHEDIDQFFSKISGYLRTHDAYDREGVVHAATHFRPSWARDDFFCHTGHVDCAANISEWLDTKLSKFTCNVKVFSQYRLRMIHGTMDVALQGRERCAEYYDDPNCIWKCMDRIEHACTRVVLSYIFIIFF